MFYSPHLLFDIVEILLREISRLITWGESKEVQLKKILFAWNTNLWDKVFVIFHVLHVEKQNITINKAIFRCTTISKVCSRTFKFFLMTNNHGGREFSAQK
jgi:hypothetical protein